MRKPTKRSSKQQRARAKPRVWEKVTTIPMTLQVETPSAAETLTARQSTHGDFFENARVMQGLRRELRSAGNWNLGQLQDARQLHPSVLSDVAAEAIEMIVVKLGRIVTGDPNHADNWLDIEGYARLARERL